MRHPLVNRFWRNFLLTSIFTCCTLGLAFAWWTNPTPLSFLGPTDSDARRLAVLASATPDGTGAETSSFMPKGASASSSAKAELPDADATGAQAEYSGASAPVSSSEGVSDDSDGSRNFAGGRSPRSRQNRSTSGEFTGSGGLGGGGGVGAGSSKTAKQAGEPARSNKAAKNNNGNSSGNAGVSGPNRGNGPVGVVPVHNGPFPGGIGNQENSGPGGSPASTPEPISMVLVGTGLLGLYGARRHLR